jgi:transposase
MANRSRVMDAGSRMEPDLLLTDEQWQQIADIFPHDSPGPEGGRPRHEPRACIEGILWVLVTGARWKDMPRRFPSYATCWRRFKAWTEAGLWQKAWSRLVRKLDRLGRVDWEQSLADGTFSPAKKGAIA